LNKLSKHENKALIPGDRDQIGALSASYVRKKKAVLIFCPTKNGCEDMATRLSNILPK
jgi:replicative superfamily II helicase